MAFVSYVLSAGVGVAEGVPLSIQVAGARVCILLSTIETSWPGATPMVLIVRAFRRPELKRPNFASGSARSAISDMNAVEAFVIGDCNERELLSRLIRERSSAPVSLRLNERHSLDDTLGLFAAGADDVVRKPVHVREIVARVGAINRRVFGEKGNVTIGELRVYFDGREPEVNGKPFPLPRRERRILEFLLRCRGRRVSKTQIFNAVYGLFDQDVDENVIESHISKLRKKLKHRLGFDPIDSKRFLGYCIEKQGA